MPVVDMLVNEGFFNDYLTAKMAINRKKVAIAGQFFTLEHCVLSGTTVRVEVDGLPKNWEPLGDSKKYVHPKEVGQSNKKVTIHRSSTFAGCVPWMVTVRQQYRFNELTFPVGSVSEE